MTFMFNGVEIDLACGRLHTSVLEEHMAGVSDDVIKNLDQRTIRSLNGTRVAHAILRNVPDISTYRRARPPPVGIGGGQAVAWVRAWE